MRKLAKKDNGFNMHTVEAYVIYCTCICQSCGCWGDILWIGNDQSSHEQPNNPEK